MKTNSIKTQILAGMFTVYMACVGLQLHAQAVQSDVNGVTTILTSDDGGTTGLLVTSTMNKDLALGTRSSNGFWYGRMYVKYNTGYVGIGTSTPKGLLHVAGDYYGKGHMWLHAFEGDGTSGTAYIQGRDQSGASSINVMFRTQLNGSVRDALFLKNTADIGIGTSSPLDKLDLRGTFRVVNKDNASADYDNLRLYADGTKGYIESNGDEDGMMLRSNIGRKFTFDGFTFNLMPNAMTGNQVTTLRFADPDNGTGPMSIQYKDDGSPDLAIMGGRLGINNLNPAQTLDVTGNIKGNVFYADKVELSAVNSNTLYGYNAGQAFTGAGNVAIGRGSASAINNANYSVFLGYNAGSDFSHVTFEGGQNPLTNGKSVFVVNNQAQLHNPLLFGVFVDNTDKDDPNHRTTSGSMAQLAINTHHLVDSCALTVAGAVHIGPKDLDPSAFPTDSLYEDYLLWAERGVVSENFAIVKVEDWSDFVFNSDYELRNLEEVEQYIKTNGHLPEMPSEAEVTAHGYSVHDINKRLLQKVEELTLYIIDQEKRIKETEQLLEKQKQLEERINALEKKY